MNKDKFWKLVEELDWANTCRLDSKSRDAFAQEVFKKMNMTSDDIIMAKNYAKALREILQDKIEEYSLLKYGDKYAFPNNSGVISVGDDGFWDLCAHIVGLGKDVYEQACKNPEAILSQPDYVENFEYLFNTYEDFADGK